ncbi:MAG: Gfo/Idh/MocA family protein [Kiritimatiellia bacterium]|nr:Gfo/Idh/MocA family oxidoreductase [Lentisphaerota bacterium]
MCALKLKPHRGKEIKLGVMGSRRGRTFMKNAAPAGLKLVAICDNNSTRLDSMRREYPGVKAYDDYERMLKSGIDAVVLANFAHEHAPFAIMALQHGVHVMSESVACRTLAQGVELARTVENSGRIYMYAENYCYIPVIQEMRRRYRQGAIGTALFCQGEYIHPMSTAQTLALTPGHDHWRNWRASTFYSTHAMGPIMYITGERPVAVNARSVPFPSQDDCGQGLRRGDIFAALMCMMSNQSTCITTGWSGLPGHGNWYRVHGSRGLMENIRERGMGQYLRMVHEPWQMRADEQHEVVYDPPPPIQNAAIQYSGHGGSDFFTSYYFAEAIRKGRQPFLNVYRGLDMTIIGIQGWKSCLDNGNGYEIPDFRKESVRKQHENDHFSVFPQDRCLAPNQPPPSVNGFNEPSAAMKKSAEKTWKQMGFKLNELK